MWFKGFDSLVARRISTGGNNGVAAFIAVAGVGCAVAVMLLTLSVAEGFRSSIRHKLGGFDADVVVQPPYDYVEGRQLPYLELTAEIQSYARQAAGQTYSASTAIRLPGMLKTSDDFATLVFTGFGSGHNDTFEQSNIIEGVWPDFQSDSSITAIVISRPTALRLQLSTGDKCDAYFFVDERIRVRRFTISGIYASDFGDFDNTVCYASLRELQKICGVDSLTVTAYELRGFSDDRIPQVAEHLQQSLVRHAQLNNDVSIPVVDNSLHTGAIYINWLNLLDTNVVVIFVLMCAVAAFTLVSSLFILILNNIPTIGLLRAMGASKRSVRSIFILVSMRLVGGGLLLGNAFALLIIWIQSVWHILPLDPDMYYLSYVPVSFDFIGFILIDLGVVLMAWLTLILPARIAGTISPARTMRYE